MKKALVALVSLALVFAFVGCGEDAEVQQLTECGSGGVYVKGVKVIDFTIPGYCEGLTTLEDEGKWGSISYDCTLTKFECNGGFAVSYEADCKENGSCVHKRK